MKIDIKNIIITVLGATCLIFAWILWSRPAPVSGDEILIEQKFILEAEKNRLLQEVANRDKTNLILKNQIDSIKNVEKDVEIRYKTIYEKIKKLPVSALALEFEREFANHNIE